MTSEENGVLLGWITTDSQFCLLCHPPSVVYVEWFSWPLYYDATHIATHAADIGRVLSHSLFFQTKCDNAHGSDNLENGKVNIAAGILHVNWESQGRGKGQKLSCPPRTNGTDEPKAKV